MHRGIADNGRSGGGPGSVRGCWPPAALAAAAVTRGIGSNGERGNAISRGGGRVGSGGVVGRRKHAALAASVVVHHTGGGGDAQSV